LVELCSDVWLDELRRIELAFPAIQSVVRDGDEILSPSSSRQMILVIDGKVRFSTLLRKGNNVKTREAEKDAPCILGARSFFGEHLENDGQAILAVNSCRVL
jgi:hypothetical protein